MERSGARFFESVMRDRHDSYVRLGAYLVLVIGTSIATLRWLEDPARRWIRRRFAQAR